jgi:hypothetical protein
MIVTLVGDHTQIDVHVRNLEVQDPGLIQEVREPTFGGDPVNG